jgi:uncharacterized protein YbjQ (UPF0145 family)
MIVTTGFEIQDKPIAEYLGVVRGIVVRATGIGAGFIGGLKSIAGGISRSLPSSANKLGWKRSIAW